MRHGGSCVCFGICGTRTFLRGEDSSNQPQFLIQAVSDPVPYSPETRILPSTIAEPQPSGQQYSAEWIGCRAAANIPLADLMRGDLKADSSSIQKPNSKQRATLVLRNRLQEFRIARQSQIAASQAMMIHYGLATLEALQSIQSKPKRRSDCKAHARTRLLKWESPYLTQWRYKDCSILYMIKK